MAATLAVIMVPMEAFEKDVSAAENSVVTDYLQDTDIITISPAENHGNQTLTDSEGWSLTIQNNNTSDGNDLQMWQYGVSDKLRVWHYNHSNAPADNSFWLCAVNWRETPSSRFVDVEGKNPKKGSNIHVWHAKNKLKDNKSKWFQLVNDNDSDPETYYIKNVRTNLYLAPENYFKGDNECLAKGKNTVLSDQEFKWRVEVINRTPDAVKSQREWMKNISGSTHLSEINIPGTHDSSTANVEGSWNEGANSVACQKYFIREMLEVGVRAFDLRMKFKSGDGLIMLHGQNWAVCHTEDTNNMARNLTFDDVMGYYKEYLEKHPSETIIATFKNDNGNEAQTSKAFKEVIDKYSNIMYDWSSTSPTLNDVRGKVVGFSRIGNVTGGIYGPNISKWDDNYNPSKNNHAQLINNSKPEVYVQDYYKTSATPKSKYVYNTVVDANTSGSGAALSTSFLINYTSCTSVNPLTSSRIVNQYVRTDSKFRYYIDNKKRLGITAMDYIDAQLAKMIYQSNRKSNYRKYINTILKSNDIYSINSRNYTASYSPESSEDSTSIYKGDDYTLTVTWPTPDTLMYGYSLADAAFEGGFAEVTLNDGSSYIIDGEFAFKDFSIYPSVSDSNSTQYTLTFVPLDSEFPILETKTTLTVVKRPLKIYIGDYKQQYGDTADSWRDIVLFLGRVAEKDWDQLSKVNMVIEKDGIDNNLNFNKNTKVSDILTADLPIGSKGAVYVNYEDKKVKDFPNYDINVQATGTWEIVPRELTIEWNSRSHYLTGDKVNVTADIGNIYNDEDVDVEINTVQGETIDGTTEYTATAVLIGADAANYELPEYSSSFTYTVSDAAKTIMEPDIRLSETDFIYDGKEKTPDVSLYDDGVLIPSDEYTIEYSDNVKSGLASVTITDKTGGCYDLVFSDDSGNKVNSTTLYFVIESNIEGLIGDANDDGVVSIRDAAFIARKLAQGKADELPECADYNEDGFINVRDAAAIAIYLATANK